MVSEVLQVRKIRGMFSSKYVLPLCLCALIFLRAPDLLPARFWAEDLKLFLHQALTDGISSLFTPYAGYIHVVPRTVALIASLLPLPWAPWIFFWATLAFTLWSASIIARNFDNWLAGFIAVAALVIAPGWDETIGSVTNLQWIMAPAMLFLVISPEKIRRGEAVIFAILAGLSGPFSAILGPISAFCFLTQLRYGKFERISAVAIFAGAVQFLFVMANPTTTAANAPKPLWLLLRLGELPFSMALWSLAAAVCLIATIRIGGLNRERLLLVLGIALLTLGVAVKFHHDPLVFETGSVAQRYWYVPGVLWMLIGASAITSDNGLTKLIGCLGLVLMLWHLPTQSLKRYWPWPTEDWHVFVEQAKKGPAEYHYAPDWKFSLQ